MNTAKEAPFPCPQCGEWVNLSNYGRCWHCGQDLRIAEKRRFAESFYPWVIHNLKFHCWARRLIR